MASKEIQLGKDIKDAIDKIKQLQEQIEHPTRKGMIEALRNARISALPEITSIELMQGDTQFMLWDNFSDADLYRKLGQYQQGLKLFLVAKVGEYGFQKLMEK